MAIRVQDGEVRAIIPDTATIPMAPFIEVANRMTDYVDRCDTTGVLVADQLRDIELYLAAFFYEATDQQYDSRQTGKASATFQGKTGMFLEDNKWGQRAMLIDVTGCLAGLNDQAKNKRKKVGVVWLGKPKSSQTDYVDRD